jgi:predicted DNA binding CopG/RHH family protein
MAAESAFRNWSSPSSSSASFAGLLASLTSPDRRTASEPTDDELADDVATLSYEQALRTHVRYKPSAPNHGIASHPTGAKTCGACGARRDNPATESGVESNAHETEWDDAPDTDARLHAARNADAKKCASITIRMSKSECEQLKRRAAEAGLTISAYLRSCTFEADALRAEVKKTLADLRKPAAIEKSEPRHTCLEWLLQLMPPWHIGQRVARA